MTDFEKFIIEHADSDTASLMLSMKKWPAPEDFNLGKTNPKDLAINTIEARKKLRKKVPDWWERTDLIYPTALCAEQCSSSATARVRSSRPHRRAGDRCGSLLESCWRGAVQ